MFILKWFLLVLIFYIHTNISIGAVENDGISKHLKNNLNIKSQNSFNLILDINDCLQCSNSYLVFLLKDLKKYYKNYKINIVTISENPKDSYFVKEMYPGIDLFIEDNSQYLLKKLKKIPSLVHIKDGLLYSIEYDLKTYKKNIESQKSADQEISVKLEEKDDFIRSIKKIQIENDTLYILGEYINKIISFNISTGELIEKFSLNDTIAYRLVDSRVEKSKLEYIHSFRHFRIDDFNISENGLEILFRTPRKYIKRLDGNESYVNRMGIIKDLRNFNFDDIFMFDSLKGSTNKLLPGIGDNRIISYRWWGLSDDLSGSNIDSSYLFINYDISTNKYSPGFNHSKILQSQFKSNLEYDYYLTSNKTGDFFLYLPVLNRLIKSDGKNITSKNNFFNKQNGDIGDIICNDKYLYFSSLNDSISSIIVNKYSTSLKLLRKYEYNLDEKEDTVISYYIVPDEKDNIYLLLKWKNKRFELVKL